MLWGTQRSQQEPTSTVDGVVGLWYAKAPGLDRSGDALRHANLSGVPPTGGVLAAVGDDPECKSSTVPSSTEWTLADLAMPALAAGDGAGGARPRPPRLRAVPAQRLVGGAEAPQRRRRRLRDRRRRPADAGGRAATSATAGAWAAHLDDRMFAPWSMLLEEEAVGVRLDAVHHYVRAAGLDVVHGRRSPRGSASSPPARPTATSSTALADLGIELGDLDALGIRVFKPALVWPLEPTIVRAVRRRPQRDRGRRGEARLPRGAGEVAAVRHDGRARGHRQARPRRRAVLVPAGGVLDVTVVAERAAQPARAARRSGAPAPGARPDRRRRRSPGPHAVLLLGLPAQPLDRGARRARSPAAGSDATAWRCSRADRATGTTQMGGEGAQWVGASMFSSEPHRFQNMGDGTLAHSGFLAVRQAVAAGTTVTFKILANGVVAMTGGQHAAGSLSIPALTRQLEAEGVRRIDVISDEPGRLRAGAGLRPRGAGARAQAARHGPAGAARGARRHRARSTTRRAPPSSAVSASAAARRRRRRG